MPLTDILSRKNKVFINFLKILNDFLQGTNKLNFNKIISKEETILNSKLLF